jgi:hypothetical protein
MSQVIEFPGNDVFSRWRRRHPYEAAVDSDPRASFPCPGVRQRRSRGAVVSLFAAGATRTPEAIRRRAVSTSLAGGPQTRMVTRGC